MNYTLISNISRILWLIPPIRQYKSKFFYFFLFMAVTEPTTYIIRNVFHSRSNINMVITSLCVLFSLFGYKTLKKYIFFVLSFSILVLLLNFTQPVEMTDLSIMMFVQISIFIILLKRTITQVIYDKKINLFYIVLLLYTFIQITKMLNVILYFADALYYFVLTTIVDYFFAVFFMIFREDSKQIIFPLKSLEELET